MEEAYSSELARPARQYKEKANAVFMSDEDVAKADALIHKNARGKGK